MSLFGGGSRRGRPPGSRAGIDPKTIVAALFLIILVVGAMTYFGSAIGSKTVDFVDLEIHVGSIALPINTYGGILGQDIIGITGFNGFIIKGTVRANRDLPYSGIWVAVRVHIAAFTKYDPAGCGRVFYTGPYFMIPDTPNGYFGILNLAGMRAGETKSFEFAMTAQDVLKWTYYHSFAYQPPPQGIDGWSGRVEVAIIDTGGNEPRKQTVEYEVLQPIKVIQKRDEVVRWEFQYKYGQIQYGQPQCIFRCVGFGADDIEVQSHSIELYPQSVDVKVKLSATFALVSIIVIMIGTMMAIFKIKERRR
ncbi:hypothetical protein D9Q81_05870 [Candidatus Korarchaeum cryptofilum]|uniref:Uncharacterized protein n=1 Tax=Candidatus Korarchaeum cryptofilum TaxID=498846 RepID=A0A429G416_9CREN|nr:hypothetical protein [Candidatus Korarchaeum cryptofilum]RSN68536.1 hypothetical protein D9Q81_05870 [Candidatus Korarchaeum cryptofilum]